MEIDVKTLTSLVALAFTISNAVLGFMWKSLKDELKEIKANISSKADKKEMDQRRDDIKQLFEEVHNLERRVTETVNKSVTEILIKFAEIKGEKDATVASSRQRRS